MDINQGDVVRVIRAPGMPRMQALHVGQVGPVLDVCKLGVDEESAYLQYRVYLGAGKTLDFVAGEIELLTKGAAHAGH